MLDAIKKDGNGGYIVPTGSTVNITINITLEGASNAKLAQEASRVTQEIKGETSRVVTEYEDPNDVGTPVASRVIEDQSGETSRVHEL